MACQPANVYNINFSPSISSLVISSIWLRFFLRTIYWYPTHFPVLHVRTGTILTHHCHCTLFVYIYIGFSLRSIYFSLPIFFPERNIMLYSYILYSHKQDLICFQDCINFLYRLWVHIHNSWIVLKWLTTCNNSNGWCYISRNNFLRIHHDWKIWRQNKNWLHLSYTSVSKFKALVF